jgi:hypothetical protein
MFGSGPGAAVRCLYLFDFRQLARPLAVQLSPTAPFSSYRPCRPAFLGVDGPPQLWPHPVEGVAHRGDRKQEGRGSLLGMSALQRTAGLVDVPGLKLCLSADTLVSEGSTVPRRSAAPTRRPWEVLPFPPGSLRTAGQGPIAAVRRSVVGGHWNGMCPLAAIGNCPETVNLITQCHCVPELRSFLIRPSPPAVLCAHAEQMNRGQRTAVMTRCDADSRRCAM